MGRTVQIVFSAFAIAMLALFAVRVSTGAWTVINWGMLLVAALACLVVFVRFMHIFTYGYACSAIGIAMLLFAIRPSVAAGLLATVAILYGVRMAMFIWRRERSHSYARKAAEIARREKDTPAALRLVLWFLCTWLFAYHLMAVYFVAARGELNVGVIVGALVMLSGVVLEGVADTQKQRAKNIDPDQLVTTGLFKQIRHPNFLGEILVQVGLVIAGASAVSTWQELAMVSLAPGYLIFLMVYEARRLDALQRERYGQQPVYENWRASTGALLPFPRIST